MIFFQQPNQVHEVNIQLHQFVLLELNLALLLPDWMQFSITVGMFGLLYWILHLLFHPTLELDETHRDLLNIILGSFIASFGKTIDFWFRHSKKAKEAK